MMIKKKRDDSEATCASPSSQVDMMHHASLDAGCTAKKKIKR